MNRLVKICFSALIFLSLVSCSSLQFKYSALNYASSLDGIYTTDTTVKVPKVNYFNNGFNFYSDLYFNNYNRYSWQYPYYGWNYPYYWDRPYTWYFNTWTYSPAIYYRPFIRPQPPRVRVRGYRGSNINYNRNDQTIRPNTRTPRTSESRSDGM